MRAFDEKIASLLQAELRNEPIFFVGLGAHDFQLAFGDLKRLQNEARVDFHISGVDFQWHGGPSPVPVWLLVGQIPQQATIESPLMLRLTFASGDWICLHTEEGPYECQIFEWADGAMSIY